MTKKSPVKLGQDDLEIVEETLSGPGWPLVINCISQLVRRRGEDVLTLEDSRLLLGRAKYQGSLELLQDIKNLKEILKLKSGE